MLKKERETGNIGQQEREKEYNGTKRFKKKGLDRKKKRERERNGWSRQGVKREETSREKQRRSTKEEVITAQQGPDERALMTEADGAPLPNEQVGLMRNAK